MASRINEITKTQSQSQSLDNRQLNQISLRRIVPESFLMKWLLLVVVAIATLSPLVQAVSEFNYVNVSEDHQIKNISTHRKKIGRFR